jgi:DNA-directed RNA polymerase subunit E'/Rpb7
MEQSAIFEEKVFMTPKDMNLVSKKTIDDILLDHLKKKIEGKCSQHGYVIPNSLAMLSRSMGHLENGRFTGNIVYLVQAQGNVYSPYNGMIIRGSVLKKNKMGLYIIYRDSIRVLVPRDLHIGNEAFESIQVGEEIEIELRKSRFQINDPFILSVGVLRGRTQGAKIDTENKSPQEQQVEDDEQVENEEQVEEQVDSEAEGEEQVESEAEGEEQGEEA